MSDVKELRRLHHSIFADCNIILSLGLFPTCLAFLLGRCHLALATLITWNLLCNSGFTFTALINGLSLSSCMDSSCCMPELSTFLKWRVHNPFVSVSFLAINPNLCTLSCQVVLLARAGIRPIA